MAPASSGRTSHRAAYLAPAAMVIATALGPGPLGSPAVAMEGEDGPATCSTENPQYIRGPGRAVADQGFARTWRIATGNGVTVAVVDSGIDTRNEHLRDAVIGTYTAPGLSGPYLKQPDVQGHGTAVASIIAGRPFFDRSSMVGAAYRADLLSARVYVAETEEAPELGPDATRMAQGIRWAVRAGADVINVSMSTPEGDPAVVKIRAATDLAAQNDVVVVASAGDLPSNTDPADVEPGVRFPAGAPGVIGVSALNGRDYVDAYTLTGPHVDVAADGSGVLIAFRNAGDCLAAADPDGATYSSWATAFVSGLAAQLRERYPDETAEQITYRILASAQRPKQSERWNDEFGWGTVSPYSALTMTLDPSRPGPPFPGATESAAPGARTDRPALRPLTLASDPREPTRNRLLWWSIGSGGALALLLLLRPLLRRGRV